MLELRRPRWVASTLVGWLACAPAPAPVAPEAPTPAPPTPRPDPANAQPEAPRPTETVGSVPLRRAKTGHILVPVEFEDRRFEFILDTGASISVITPTTRAAIGMPDDAGNEVPAAGANGDIANVRIVELANMRVAGRVYALTMAAVMSLEHLEGPLGEALPGILGQSFLAEHHLELDFAARTVTLHPREADPPRLPDAVVVDYEFFAVAALIKLQVSVNGSKPFPALLDLGAARSILNWRAAKLLGLDPQSPDLERAPEPMLGADNQPLELRVHRFDQIDVGTHRVDHPELYIGDIGVFQTLDMADGPAMVFGVDMFAGQRIVIDYAAQQIQVAPG